MTSAPPDLLEFSDSVRAVAGSFVGPVTPGQIATALMSRHGVEYGAPLLTGPLPDEGAERPVEEWLGRCASLLSAQAVGDVIDGRLVLLALSRMDEPLGRAFRRSGVERHLNGADVLVEWARRTIVHGYVQRVRIAGEHVAVAFEPSGIELVVAGRRLVRHKAATGERISSIGDSAGVRGCGYTSDGTLVALLDNGDLVLPPSEVIGRHPGAVSCTVSGMQVATFTAEGAVQVRRVPTGDLTAELLGDVGGALSLSGVQLSLPTQHGTRVWTLDPSSTDPRDLDAGGPTSSCVFSPDEDRVAAVLRDGRVAVWDLSRDTDGWDVFPGPARACAFNADGTLLLTAGLNGVQAIDVVGGVLRGDPTGGDGTITRLVPGPDGLVATIDRGGTTIWEPITSTSMLASVSPDSADGTDHLNIAADAEALADVIAARSTSPPLSIGLFADWGSGKSFLIRKVQERVRILSERARAAPESAAHCSHIRNVEFNAWHFADANLWASLASHILDALAKPEVAGDDAATAASQLARLEEKLAAESAVGKRLDKAHEKTVQAEARRRLVIWTIGLTTGRDGVKTLEELNDARGRLRLAAVAFAVFVVLAVVLVLMIGVDAIPGVISAAIAGAATATAALNRLSTLLKRAGPATPIEAVKSTDARAEADAAKAREAALRREYEDLAHGRALARYAAERGAAGDYRSQLGLISRIHDDFERMSKILLRQGDAVGDDDQLPKINRIVLYIDDLDRCPPKRVVEVLEAVHLILALELFVVIIAVDPRWLLQSLRLHYADLLQDEGELEEAWESTPLNYLEKIIQIPFTLRPMASSGTTALVNSLLPVFETSHGDDPLPESTGPGEPVAPKQAGDVTVAVPTASATASAPAPAIRVTTSVNTRRLILTDRERDYATKVARELRTPRAVKKLTNIYRLVRARLNEDSDELDSFLTSTGADIAEYEAVLILLTVLIAYPDTAAELLLAFGDLDPSARPQPIAWSSRDIDGRLGVFLDRATAATANGATTSTEPFRRWARELSRYSFETGQEVFSKAR